MAVVERAKAKAKVALVTGTHVNYFDTMEAAEVYAADASNRAEAMGLKARYVAQAI